MSQELNNQKRRGRKLTDDHIVEGWPGPNKASKRGSFPTVVDLEEKAGR